MDRGAWQDTVLGVAKSRTRLSNRPAAAARGEAACFHRIIHLLGLVVEASSAGLTALD